MPESSGSTKTYDDLRTLLTTAIGDDLIDFIVEREQLRVTYAPAARVKVLQTTKAAGFLFYAFCAGVDWIEENRMEVLDHVYDINTRRRVTVRCSVDRATPRVDTAVNVYGGANWHEREAAELFGIIFTGHPSPYRLLLPDFFEGFPMRKDYVMEARQAKPWPGESFSG